MNAVCKLGHVADHALHLQCPKIGFLLVGLPGETERPFNPHRVELLAFYMVVPHFPPKKLPG